MGDNKGETTKKQQQQSKQQPQPQPQQQQQISSSSPKDPILDESTESARPHHHGHQHQQQSTLVVSGASHIISAPLFIPSGATSSSPFDQQFDQAATATAVVSTNPKRPRYTTGQWKLLPSPSSQQKQTAQVTVLTGESSPVSAQQQPQLLLQSTAASSSDTASSPSHSLPSLSASGQDTSKPDLAGENPIHQQFRKGKYVSPVWKPNEMLWLARAWRVQYQGGSSPHNGSGSSSRAEPGGTDHLGSQTKGKTRADKDREVAEFLQRHGVNRDAKTAGTKWDNMLGEFRKVYEWERGGEREQVGKSYFRLSPYERKLHRLPASFDEEVFEELSQFMGSKMRTPQGRPGAGSLIVAGDPRSLPGPPPSFKEDDQFPFSARTTKQLIMGSAGEAFYYGGRGALMGFESAVDIGGPSPPSISSKELRRIGKIRMTWEESVSLWAEEAEHNRGRVKLQGSSFLNADELTYLDDAMVACNMEAFEEGPLRGFSVDRFVSGQQVKVFGRKKPFSVSASGFPEKVQLPLAEPSVRSTPPWEFQDPTDHYVGCLRVPPPSIPTLFELSWYLQEPPPEELRFPLRKDVYRDLPQGKDLFFTISNELLDCRTLTYDILSPILRTNPSLTSSTSTGRDSFIGLWDDCINRIVSKFCSVEMVNVRKPTNNLSSTEVLQDQWPNVTGFVRSFCLWRGEETDQLREGQIDPSNSIVEKLLWTYQDLPYILGYYAVGFLVTFCALSRGANQDRIIRTDLQTLDLSSPSDRLKALVPCYRVASLLPLLADRCFNSVNNIINVGSSKMFPYSDFERLDMGNGNVTEITPNTVTRFYPNRRKWGAVKEIYDFLDHRIPHAEFIHHSSEKDLGLVFKPRGYSRPSRPTNIDQLVEALKCVTKALVALHDLSFMHRDLSWDKVVRRVDRENEWFVAGFEEAVVAPQIYPMMVQVAGAAVEQVAARGRQAPEMERGLHGVKVDVWGVGYLVRTCGVAGVPKMLRELQSRCLDQNPEQRPTAADCYHHLLQLQSSLQSPTASGVVLM
ncbi:Protein kinase-like domain containing protein [Trema orientale]|uniref:Protein kinase-like domain containing protein n=1 Tax=Trema orientale TaxID=63057 RepID=A0A2P5ER88_TREOI|nr:Protein kinase-like domain containing protein [Trema orientale]